MKNYLFIFALIISTQAFSETYKCTDTNGKKVYSQIPCASDAAKLNVEEPEWRKQQIETNIAVKKLVADAKQREFEEKQKEAERVWRENELLRLQREQVELARRQVNQPPQTPRPMNCVGGGTSYTTPSGGLTIGNSSMSCF